jgi:hypothetical protein
MGAIKALGTPWLLNVTEMAGAFWAKRRRIKRYSLLALKTENISGGKVCEVLAADRAMRGIDQIA